MAKTKCGNSAKYKIVEQNNGLAIFLVYPQHLQAMEQEEKENFLNDSSNCVPYNNQSNDVFVSLSGQKKLDSLVSCRDFSSCDFIMF